MTEVDVSLYDPRARLLAEKQAIDEARKLRRLRADEIRRLEEDQAYAAAKARLTAPAKSAPDMNQILDAVTKVTTPAIAKFVRETIDERLLKFATEQTNEITRQLEPLQAIIYQINQDNKQHPPMRYRGIWNERVTYPAGSVCTRSGVFWHADKATIGEPPGKGPPWTMMDKSAK